MKRSNSVRLNSKSSNIPKLQRSSSLRINGDNRPLNSNDSPVECETQVPNRPQNFSNWKDRIKHYSGDNSRGFTPSEPTTPDMDDKSSVKSFGSCASFMSCDITTNHQGSDLSLTRHTSRGQHKKYVLHCQHHIQAQPEYLTPTQRKDRQIRHLKAELIHSKRASEEKDVEIERLKSEVERLRIALTEARFSDLHLDTLLEDQPNLEVIEEQDNLSDDNCNKYTDNECMDKIYNPGSPPNDDHCLEDSGILTDLSECQGDNCSLGKSLRELAQESAALNESSKDCKSPETNLKLHNTENISKVAFQKLLAFYNRNDANQFSKHKHETLSDEMEKRNITIKKSQSFSSRQHLSPLNAEENVLAEHQRQLNDMKYFHSIEYQEMKEKYNDRVENLLQKLSDANARFAVRKKTVDVDSTGQLSKTAPSQYMELRPSLDCAQNKVRQLESQLEELRKEMTAQEEWHSQMYLKMYRHMEVRPSLDCAQNKVRQLESQLEELRKEMTAQEEWHNQMYLKMYRKGQEAAKFEHADEVLEFAHKAPKRVSVPELLQQLHRTEHELDRTKQLYRCELYKQATKGNGDRHSEYTLKFLRDAMYYFLTEKDNKGHLQAIESILDFTDSERLAVSKALKMKRL